MKENLILQITVGDVYKKMSKLTQPLARDYAERIGADYISIEESQCSSPHWEKFLAIYKYLNQYKRILYLDVDTLVRKDCPDIFKVIPSDKLALFNEMPYTSQRDQSMYEACKEYGVVLPTWNGRYYNTGVMVISRHFKYLFKKPDKEAFNFYEQGYFNAILAKHIAQSENGIYPLSYKFNRMTCMDQFTGEERFASYIMHYAGYPSIEMVMALIQKDIKKWEESAPQFKYKKHILISAEAGLGDQICAEPAIRYLKEKVYPDDDINIATHFPRIYKHLEELGISVFKHGDFVRKFDTPYYHVNTLPGPETIAWQFVSGLLSHTIDFSSMILLRRILPIKDKRVKLITEQRDMDNLKEVRGMRTLEDLVVVHAGRHWESKTFPNQWWEEVVEGLVEEGLSVCLIGKTEDIRGTLDIECPDSVLDLRELLELGTLFALLSKAKLLISNDSAPVHIAGAFDNDIILIPSCKHPEHVLPWRNGSQFWKTEAFYKKLTIDDVSSQPTETEGISGEFVKGKWEDYLPDTKLVIMKALEICRSKEVV